ncbi:MAG TPA: branched-chain amino acid ABC transporter permease, partial [Solirubrobacteraceae bacterium]|nr:branched-chain amino acid ABC transporter permease [Solirubrobacteraceae bacterium]
LRLSRRVDGGMALTLLLLALVLPTFASSEYVLLGASIVVSALVAASFNLLYGYTAMFSFGQAVFYGLGAYATVLLVNEAGLSFFPALLAGALVALAVAAITGLLLVRLESIAFIMLTFALAALLEFVAEHSPRLTSGDSGVIADLPDSLNPVLHVDLSYYAILAVAVAVLAGLYAFLRSPAGLLLRAIREDPLRARTLGLAVERRRLAAFVLAGAIAAFGGGLSVLSAQIVYPDVFDWRISAAALIATLLGGPGRFSGPLLGALLLGLIDFYVAKLTTDTLLVEGLVLMAVILLAPRGLMGLRPHHRLGRRPPALAPGAAGSPDS